MPASALGRIRDAVRNGNYDLTAHAMEEAAEDDLDIIDLEFSILGGQLVKTQRGDSRGMKFVVHGRGTDGATLVATVGRFTETDRYLIVTVYAIEQEKP
ncbi:MAG: DUF4258 domain-containing protein [Planctomycetes bacterium]|nr:DUF4258 domain-containing protein [Planctomycetota bacterium]